MDHAGGRAERLTLILEDLGRGRAEAANDLLPVLYEELRSLARAHFARRVPGQTLQATALVHEAWIRLVGQGDPGWDSRAHFFGAAAQAMRCVLVDQERRRQAIKRQGERGGSDEEAPLIEQPVEDVLAVHEALERLETKQPELAKIVVLRFFGGLSMGEIANTVGSSLRSVERSWSLARVWLRGEVQGAADAL